MVDDTISYDDYFSIVSDRGVLKKIIKKGRSPFSPHRKDIACIHYVGRYHFGEKHGQIFDSSRAREKPICVPLCNDYPIKAFNVAIQTMKLGEVCEIVAYPDYGYYDSQIRRYEIELIAFCGKTLVTNYFRFFVEYACSSYEGSNVLVSTIKSGVDFAPIPGEITTISLEGYYNEVLFDRRNVTILFGDFDNFGLPESLYEILPTFNVGSEHLCQLHGPLSFTNVNSEAINLPKGAILWYRITVDFDGSYNGPDKYAGDKENFHILLRVKNRANEYFKAGKYTLAKNMYNWVVQSAYILYDNNEYHYLCRIAFQNCALCFLKMNKPDKCLEICDQCIKKDPENVKCLYRQGLAYLMKNDYKEAYRCFTKVLLTGNCNRDAAKKLDFCRKILSRENIRENIIINGAIRQLGEVICSGMSEAESEFVDFTSLVSDGGVLKKVIKSGHTDISPVKGETVVVHYVGFYHGGDEDGTKFDSSRDRNEPLKYESEQGHVIKGWDIAIPTMKLGEMCELIVSSEYGYQDKKTRRFEIELLDFYGRDVSPKFNGSVYLTQLTHGNEANSPRPGSMCEIHALGYCGGKVLEDRDVCFVIGDFEEVGLPEGLDRALCYMSEGEEARVRICGPMTFTPCESTTRGIPQNSILYYLVKIISCEQRKSAAVFATFHEKMEHLQSLKQKANEFIKARKYQIAVDMYSDLLSDCLGVPTNGYEQHAELNNFKCVLHQNKAYAFLKLKSPQECLEACKQGLDLNSRNEKCLYRKGEAYLLLGDHEEASNCFQEVLSINPKNVEAVQKLKLCQDTISKALQQEKKMFQNAFKRLRGMEDASGSNVKKENEDEAITSTT
ncbi:unnamed protein product [Hydatigera taeniaeformis]|uniref:peptidylprolyl isomerase n=1 Tax=Hydatigena taeniaeformis TaxID=6205 RepID=A0A158RF89_HYDTA|nr:unnamed protein product [Hydatigera taeniaeformis]